MLKYSLAGRFVTRCSVQIERCLSDGVQQGFLKSVQPCGGKLQVELLVREPQNQSLLWCFLSVHMKSYAIRKQTGHHLVVLTVPIAFCICKCEIGSMGSNGLRP